jgi:hypothetical protein
MSNHTQGYKVHNLNEQNTNKLNNSFPNFQKRKRKKSNYKKVNNETRQKLIEMV